MSITRLQGPLVVPGAGPQITPGALDYNDSPGPSIFAHGVGICDTRFGPFNGGDITNVLPAWYGSGWINVLDQVPAALSATNIAAAQVPTAGTALTLAAASTGITVIGTGGLSIISGQTFPAGSLMIDGNPALIQVNSAAGQVGGVSLYDPRTMSARAIRITSVGNDSSGTMAVVGVDMYGYLVHETVTLANAGIATSVKCYKAIVSLTPGGTLSGSNVSVGTGDVYEFGLASYEFAFAQIYWNSTLISASTGYTAAVTTSPATATTGDVRGKYAVQSASDGTKKLQMFVMPQVWNLTKVGLWGVVQY
jgi:hypothetical protein